MAVLVAIIIAPVHYALFYFISNRVVWMAILILVGEIYIFLNVLTPTVEVRAGRIEYRKFFMSKWSAQVNGVFATYVTGGDLKNLPALRFFRPDNSVLGDVPLFMFCDEDKKWLRSFVVAGHH